MICAWAADDATAFFRRCKDGLKPDGLIFVKENICSADQKFAVDKVHAAEFWQSLWTIRPNAHLLTASLFSGTCVLL